MTFLFAKPTEIAIRSLVYLARQKEDRHVTLDEIAEEEGISRNHLSVVLRKLALERLVKSIRGPQGGYVLRSDLSQIRLWDLMVYFRNDVSFNRCALGSGQCSDENPCYLHRSWINLRRQNERYLEGTTIMDLAKESFPDDGKGESAFVSDTGCGEESV